MTQDIAAPTPRRRTPVGSVVMLFIGAVLTLVGFSVVTGGVATAVAASTRQSGGFFTAPTTLFATGSYALTTPRTAEFIGDRRPADVPFDIGQVRLRATSDKSLFIGIAARADVESYLAGVRHSEVTEVRYDPFRADYRDIAGTRAPGAPTGQDFWVASSSGAGEREVTWTIQPGDWAVVVMNADGSAGVSARIQAGFRSDLIAPIAVGVLAVLSLLLVVGIPLLIGGAVGIGRALAHDAAPLLPGRAPVRLVGRTSPGLSRGLWLVKWLLAVPHYIVLALLWVALLVTTIVAGFGILFTGRYPRPLFAFNVAVLRWSWRVGFYAYSALGTDRYPPFAFERVEYPADLEVDYPERLSNGLVLVKWWLLAIPHYLVLAALTSGALVVPAALPWLRPFGTAAATGTISVLGALVLIAGFFLLFTARYPSGLFDLVMGINRWAYRVAAYTALLRDDYPPFRLDQGPDEPTDGPVPVPPRDRSAVM